MVVYKRPNNSVSYTCRIAINFGQSLVKIYVCMCKNFDTVACLYIFVLLLSDTGQ